MVIGLNYLLPKVNNGEIIQGLSARELKKPEGVGFDLRIDELYRITSSGYLGVEERETSKVELVGKVSANKSAIEMLPGEYYLAKTIETVALDSDMVGVFHPRSTLFRSGVVFQSGVQPPGFKGQLTFGIYVAGPHPFYLEMGARIAHINIFRVEGDSEPYRGQWQGGRVSTDGNETQV